MIAIDDISHKRLCLRCHRWGPEEANFCGHCGLQLRPLFAPSAVLDQEARRQHRRRRRMVAGVMYGPMGALGARLGQCLTAGPDEDRRGW